MSIKFHAVGEDVVKEPFCVFITQSICYWNGVDYFKTVLSSCFDD